MKERPLGALPHRAQRPVASPPSPGLTAAGGWCCGLPPIPLSRGCRGGLTSVDVSGGGRPVGAPSGDGGGGSCRAAPSCYGYLAVVLACGPRLPPSRPSRWDVPRRPLPSAPPSGLGLGCAAASLAAGFFSSEEEVGQGESLRPACGPMTVTPSGAVYLLEGIIFSHFSPLWCAFRVKALTMLVG
jgi:hypothetical protein